MGTPLSQIWVYDLFYNVSTSSTTNSMKAYQIIKPDTQMQVNTHYLYKIIDGWQAAVVLSLYGQMNQDWSITGEMSWADHVGLPWLATGAQDDGRWRSRDKGLLCPAITRLYLIIPAESALLYNTIVLIELMNSFTLYLLIQQWNSYSKLKYINIFCRN